MKLFTEYYKLLNNINQICIITKKIVLRIIISNKPIQNPKPKRWLLPAASYFQKVLQHYFCFFFIFLLETWLKRRNDLKMKFIDIEFLIVKNLMSLNL